MLHLEPVTRENWRDAVFLTTDPAYRVEITGGLPQVLKISGAVEVKDKDWALQEYQRRGGNTGRRWKFWK